MKVHRGHLFCFFFADTYTYRGTIYIKKTTTTVQVMRWQAVTPSLIYLFSHIQPAKEHSCGKLLWVYSNMYLRLSQSTELFVYTGQQQKLQISLQTMTNMSLC